MSHRQSSSGVNENEEEEEDPPAEAHPNHEFTPLMPRRGSTLESWHPEDSLLEPEKSPIDANNFPLCRQVQEHAHNERRSDNQRQDDREPGPSRPPAAVQSRLPVHPHRPVPQLVRPSPRPYRRPPGPDPSRGGAILADVSEYPELYYGISRVEARSLERPSEPPVSSTGPYRPSRTPQGLLTRRSSSNLPVFLSRSSGMAGPPRGQSTQSIRRPGIPRMAHGSSRSGSGMRPESYELPILDSRINSSPRFSGSSRSVFDSAGSGSPSPSGSTRARESTQGLLTGPLGQQRQSIRSPLTQSTGPAAPPGRRLAFPSTTRRPADLDMNSGSLKRGSGVQSGSLRPHRPDSMLTNSPGSSGSSRSIFEPTGSPEPSRSSRPSSSTKVLLTVSKRQSTVPSSGPSKKSFRQVSRSTNPPGPPKPPRSVFDPHESATNLTEPLPSRKNSHKKDRNLEKCRDIFKIAMQNAGRLQTGEAQKPCRSRANETPTVIVLKKPFRPPTEHHKSALNPSGDSSGDPPADPNPYLPTLDPRNRETPPEPPSTPIAFFAEYWNYIKPIINDEYPCKCLLDWRNLTPTVPYFLPPVKQMINDYL